MPFDQIPAGKAVPTDINVIIEISSCSEPTKYEVDKETGMLCVDRFIATSMIYPTNYGYVPSTLSGDGDPADVLVITPNPVQPGSLIRCRPVAMLSMEDESGEDNKVLALPIAKVCAEYAHMQTLADINPQLLARIKHFFEHYKDLEQGKWVKVKDWQDKAAAEKEIIDSVARYQ